MVTGINVSPMIRQTHWLGDSCMFQSCSALHSSLYTMYLERKDFSEFFLGSVWNSQGNCITHNPAAAKSLQSCPTLCDPIDGSPPGSHVPGILQARTVEWVAISFSNAWKWKVKVKSLNHVWLFATPWTAAYQAIPDKTKAPKPGYPVTLHLFPRKSRHSIIIGCF